MSKTCKCNNCNKVVSIYDAYEGSLLKPFDERVNLKDGEEDCYNLTLCKVCVQHLIEGGR